MKSSMSAVVMCILLFCISCGKSQPVMPDDLDSSNVERKSTAFGPMTII